MRDVGYEVALDVVSEGYDRVTEWFQPRVGIIPPATAMLTMTKARLWGSDIFTAVQQMRSDNLGQTWSEPVAQPTLDRRTASNGTIVCPCDMTPAWHAATGTLLLTGHTANYLPGEKGGLVLDATRILQAAYSVYDDYRRVWSEWSMLQMPDADRFHFVSAGCAQRVDLPGGDILLPLYCMTRAECEKAGSGSDHFVTVARCSFDGEVLRYLRSGNDLCTPGGRGFCEPSLTWFRGRFYLTLRNDLRGYVATSRDGLNYAEPMPWTFDDGEELGSYNTQQHWVTHSDGLFLAYTRRGANNDMVIRHRAPMFLAEVDPERLCVLRDTEREIIPNRGAQMGNFGVVAVSADESWVVNSECMHGDAQDPYNLDLTEARGADNRVYVCRLRWDRPNRLDELVPHVAT